MSNLESAIKQSIDTHHLLPDKEGVVICTLSGGADSVALLTALVNLGYNCVAAHCNFHLRGEESMRDQRHAVNIAAKLGVKILLKDMDVEAFCASHNASVEMACRELRYAWFYSLKESLSAQAIAVAHNYTDNVETAMLNLMRGTGIAGICGMKWRNENGVIRPMLQCKREDIEKYLTEKGLEYITDSSNLTNDYSRNRIRHILLPAFEQTQPTALCGITQTLNNVSEQFGLYRQMLDDTKKAMTKHDGIDLHAVAAHPFAALLLYEWFKHLGFSRKQMEDALNSRNTSGTRFYANGTMLVNNHGILAIADTQKGADDDFPFIITKHDISLFHPTKDTKVAYFDASILSSGLELKCRYWQQGDTLAPFGMKGSKKLSDIFSDAKLSIDQKSKVPLLVMGDTILWVGGIRASRHYPVTPECKEFIKVELK